MYYLIVSIVCHWYYSYFPYDSAGDPDAYEVLLDAHTFVLMVANSVYLC